jgi:hypothetical protein
LPVSDEELERLVENALVRLENDARLAATSGSGEGA